MEQLNRNETVNSSKSNQEIPQNAECQLKSTVQQRIGNTNINSNENLANGQSDFHYRFQLPHGVSQYQLLSELKQRYTPPNQSQIKSDDARMSNFSYEGDFLDENKACEPNWNIVGYECEISTTNSEPHSQNDVLDVEQQSCFNARNNILKSSILLNRTIIRKRSFSCKMCKKYFTQKGNLKTHIFIHSGEKRFLCTVCKKRFDQKTALNIHMLIHSGVKPFSCDVCNKLFSQKSNLKTHMLIHSGEKSFLCSICDKRFTRNHHLSRHMLTHSGEKPFLCSVCNKSFIQKSNRNAHMLTHT